VWETTTARLTAKLLHPDWVFSGRFTDDSSQLVTACRDGSARFWDFRTQQLVRPPLQTTGEMYDAVVSSNGAWAVTADSDGAAKVWELSTSRPIAPPTGIGRCVSIEMTPNWEYAITAAERDATVTCVALLDLKTQTDTIAPTLRAAELGAGQTVHTGGELANMTTDEWLRRWRQERLTIWGRDLSRVGGR
jgi:WD40 repeat protein